MPTADQIQVMIIDEVGDTPQFLLANRISLYWSAFSDKAAIHPRLQELYTKRRCLDAVLASVRDQVTFSTDGALSLQLAQRTANLREMRKETVTEIMRLEKTAQANRASVIAPLVNTELETPPLNFPVPGPVDANDERYRGSPYFSNSGTGSNSF